MLWWHLQGSLGTDLSPREDTPQHSSHSQEGLLGYLVGLQWRPRRPKRLRRSRPRHFWVVPDMLYQMQRSFLKTLRYLYSNNSTVKNTLDLKCAVGAGGGFNQCWSKVFLALISENSPFISSSHYFVSKRHSSHFMTWKLSGALFTEYRYTSKVSRKQNFILQCSI